MACRATNRLPFVMLKGFFVCVKSQKRLGMLFPSWICLETPSQMSVSVGRRDALVLYQRFVKAFCVSTSAL